MRFSFTSYTLIGSGVAGNRAPRISHTRYISIIHFCQYRLVSIFSSPKLVIKGVSYRHKKNSTSLVLHPRKPADTVFKNPKPVIRVMSYGERGLNTTQIYNTFWQLQYIL